jgi:hypothetical protein
LTGPEVLLNPDPDPPGLDLDLVDPDPAGLDLDLVDLDPAGLDPVDPAGRGPIDPDPAGLDLVDLDLDVNDPNPRRSRFWV